MKQVNNIQKVSDQFHKMYIQRDPSKPPIVLKSAIGSASKIKNQDYQSIQSPKGSCDSKERQNKLMEKQKNYNNTKEKSKAEIFQ